ncbi:MAG: hypothetical protein AAFU64_00125 [Bacteroidota bacterium]
MTSTELQSYIQDKMSSLPPEQLEKLKVTIDKLSDEVVKEGRTKEKRQLGTLPDLVEYMAPDFDEPLDCFNGYTPE